SRGLRPSGAAELIEWRPSCRFRRASFVLIGDHPEKEEAMKYMLLIHQGSTPLPGSDEWESLSDDEKNAVYGAYQSINQTPGVSPGVRMGPPETATTV